MWRLVTSPPAGPFAARILETMAASAAQQRTLGADIARSSFGMAPLSGSPAPLRPPFGVVENRKRNV